MDSDKDTQMSRILKFLKKHGEATNIELNRICYRYSARLHDLRREGHEIVSVHVKGSVWRYVYKGEPSEV